ncbi:MAG: S-layer homology domain-containing protein, partial [Clostridia bacterium]|nr:S-layer homology domain-containing protein [Clostridia bacterium]
TGTGGGGVSTGIGIPSSPKTYESKFTDITGHWAENDINEMAKKEIVKGVTETSFEPDRSITRAEFAALAVRGLKITATDSESLFEDVTPDAWYGESVIAAASAGLIQGYEGKFRPEDTITREEIAVVMMKAYQFLGKTAAAGDLTGFTDSDQISDWAKPFAAQAVGAGLISGMTDNTFAPRENATRAQATSILKRLLDQ